MTGFGEASGHLGDSAVLAFEVQSVNHRHLKLRMRLPDELAAFEAPAEAVLRHRVPRGSLTVSCRLRGSGAPRLALDHEQLAGYVAALRAVQREHELEGGLSLATLAGLPGVLSFAAASYDGQLEPFLALLGRALDQLEASRRVEGAALQEALHAQLAGIEGELESLFAILPETVKGYRLRLRKRVDELLSDTQVGLDDGSLEREVALMAEKASLQEETDRLRAHVLEMRKQLDSDGPVGRRLEFLAQEMLREANTMAAKSVDARAVHTVLAIKLRVDSIREQVSNVQ